MHMSVHIGSNLHWKGQWVMGYAGRSTYTYTCSILV